MNTNIVRPLRAFARGLGLAAALAGASFSVAALAQPEGQINVSAGGDVTRTVAVQTNDLNLADAGAQRKLERRLKVAAGVACESWDISLVRPPAEYARCYTSALESARGQAAQQTARNESKAAVPAS